MKRIKQILISLLCLVLLAGCSSKTAYDGGYYANGAESPTEEYSYGVSDNAGSSELIMPGEKKLIYSGSMTIETKTFDETDALIRNRLNEVKGYIASEYEYIRNDGRDNSHRYKTMTLRVPTEHYQSFIDALSGECRVISRSSSVDDITSEYYDVSAQIEALEMQQERLLAMMAEALTIEDMIAVEARITQVQNDLNRLKTRKKGMDTDVDYSILNISMEEVVLYSETGDSFFSEAADAISDGLRSFISVVRTFAVGLLYLWPYLLVIAVIAFVMKKTGKKFHMPKFFRRKKKDHTEV